MKISILCLVVGCGGGSGDGVGELESGSTSCPGTDTQAGLDCVLAGLKFSTVPLLKVPAFETSGSGATDAPSITSESSSATLDPSSSKQEIEFEWLDPQGYYTPAFCIQLCHNRVCSSYNMCSQGIKDGKKTGTFRSTARWTAVPTNDATTTGLGVQFTPISATGGGSGDLIKFDASVGGYVIPGLGTISTGALDKPTTPNPPTTVVKTGAPKTVSNVTFNFPPMALPAAPPPPAGGGSGGSSGGSGSGTCITTPYIGTCETLQTCVSGDQSSCWYIAGGKKFTCSSCSSCFSAASSAANHCK